MCIAIRPVLVGAAAAFIVSCSGASKQVVVNTVLDAEQFACVLATDLTDDAAIAEACHISDELRPIIRQILAGKAAAKRASLKVDAGK